VLKIFFYISRIAAASLETSYENCVEEGINIVSIWCGVRELFHC